MRRFGALIALFLAAPAFADDWPQWLGPKRDGVWRETGIIKKLPKELPFVWRKPVAEGYAGPAVAAGKVFVIDWQKAADAAKPASAFSNATMMAGTERVHCFDAKTGEKYWTFDTKGEIWSAPSYIEGKVFIGNLDGDLYVFDHGKTLKEPKVIPCERALRTPVRFVNGLLYVMTDATLFAFGKK